MLIGIMGGKLQGTEIAYLARAAGFNTILVDKDPRAPAAGLVDRFLSFDLTDRARAHDVMSTVDVVFPAIENIDTLAILADVAKRSNTPLVFDPRSYKLSSSKRSSNRLFAEIGIPVPRPFPECSFPVIAKPCFGSGSEGVRVFTHRSDLDSFLGNIPTEQWCIQEFVDGPSYSVEVVGQPGNYQAILVVELFMDRSLDCKRVVAPADVRPEIESEFKMKAIAIAEAIELKGIMDVEVILSGERLFFLEIDARFPSQTPIAVYHATGINMVAMLTDLFLYDQIERLPLVPAKSTTLEHVCVTNNDSLFEGEHVMTQFGPLRILNDFFDSEIAITSFQNHSIHWAATLINRSSRHHDASAHN